MRDPDDGVDLRLLTRRRLRELDRLRDLGYLQVERLTAEAKAIPEGQVFQALLGTKGGIGDFEKLARAIRQIVVLEFEPRGLFAAPDRDAPRKLRLVKSDRPGFEPPGFEPPGFEPPGFEPPGFEPPDIDRLMADLKDPPDRDPLTPFDVRLDYRHGPLDQVVAGIRQTLGAEPPEDDPFAPPPERAARPAAGEAPRPAPPRPREARPAQPEQPATPAHPAPAEAEFARAEPVKAEPAPKRSAQEFLARKAAALAIEATNGKGFRVKSRKSKHRQGRGPPR
jgi:hypothetical protein